MCPWRYDSLIRAIVPYNALERKRHPFFYDMLAFGKCEDGVASDRALRSDPKKRVGTIANRSGLIISKVDGCVENLFYG
jgi:hypothetical protein